MISLLLDVLFLVLSSLTSSFFACSLLSRCLTLFFSLSLFVSCVWVYLSFSYEGEVKTSGEIRGQRPHGGRAAAPCAVGLAPLLLADSF